MASNKMNSILASAAAKEQKQMNLGSTSMQDVLSKAFANEQPQMELQQKKLQNAAQRGGSHSNANAGLYLDIDREQQRTNQANAYAAGLQDQKRNLTNQIMMKDPGAVTAGELEKLNGLQDQLSKAQKGVLSNEQLNEYRQKQATREASKKARTLDVGAARANYEKLLDLQEQEKGLQDVIKRYDRSGIYDPMYGAYNQRLAATQAQIAQIKNDANYATEDEIENAAKIQQLMGLESVQGNKDFKELSQYNQSNGVTEMQYNPGTAMYNTKGDMVYDYINDRPGARSAQTANELRNGAITAGVDLQKLTTMTEEEKGVYNYLYATQGKEKAEEYLQLLSSDLNARNMDEIKDWWKQYADENPVAASAFSVAMSPARGLSYLGQAVDYAKTGKIDQNDAINKFTAIPSTIRGEVSKKVEKKWGSTGSFLYETGMSMADFLTQAAMTGSFGAEGLGAKIAETATLAIMGTGAAADATIAAKERGLSDGQAFALGTIAGAAEILTEKISLETLLDLTNMEKNMIGYLLKNTLAEGSEEGMSDFINFFADLAISKDASEWKTAIKGYMQQGMTEKEAMGRAFADQAAQVGMDVLGGMISGLAMAGGSAAINKATQTKAQAQWLSTMKQVAQMLPEESRPKAPSALASSEEILTYTTQVEKALEEENRTAREAKDTAKTEANQAITEETKANNRDINDTEYVTQLQQRLENNEIDSAEYDRLYDEYHAGTSGDAEQAAYDAGAENSTEEFLRGMEQRANEELQKRQQAAEMLSAGTDPAVVAAQTGYAMMPDGTLQKIGNANNGGVNNGEAGVSVYDGGERGSSESAGGQSGAVAGSTEAPAGSGRAGQTAEVARRAAAEKSAVTSSKQLGVQRGTDATVHTISADTDEELQTLQSIAQGAGLDVTFVDRAIQVNTKSGTKNVSGVYSDGKIIVNAVSKRNSATAIFMHEFYHAMHDANSGMTETIWNALEQQYTQEKMDELLNRAEENYCGVYDIESEDFEDKCKEEVIADLLGGMKRTGITYDEAMKKTVREMVDDPKWNAPDARRGGAEMYKINPDFKTDIDNWDGKTERSFELGETSEVLRGIGVKLRKMIISGDTINHSLKHKGMDIEIIKSIPEILETPVIVMQSRTVPDRITVFGEVYDNNNAPVLAVVEINPKTETGELIDFNRLNNAYGKDRGIINFLKNSTYLYVDPDIERTTAWMHGLRLQLPSGTNMSGSIGSVTYDNGEVNISGRTFEEVFGDVTEIPETGGSERFSMEEPEEETGNLIALHNLNEEKLSKTLSLGGFPMPSIAITRADIPHTNFGDITLVMSKDTIDPKANKKNTVYSADAWTPVFPETEYEASSEVESRIYDKFRELSRQFDRRDIDALYSYANEAERMLNRYGGEQGIIQNELDNIGMMKAFLADTTGNVPQEVYDETVTRMDDHEIKLYTYLSENIADILELWNRAGTFGSIGRKRQLIADNADRIRSVLADYLMQIGVGEEAARGAAEARDNSEITKYVRATVNFNNNGAETVKRTYNSAKTEDAIRSAVDTEQYEAWLHELFDGIEADAGIYNNKERFTSSGNRRSFKQLHMPVTLENIVKAMASQNGGNTKNVSGFVGVKTLRAGTAQRFDSIENMHELEGRLKHLSKEEAEEINDALSERLSNVISDVLRTAPDSSSNQFMLMDSVGETLNEVAESQNYSVENIKRIVNQYAYNIDDELANDIRELLFDIQQMPVNIFEAKPERVVGFDEVLAAIVPEGTSQEVVDGLRENGIDVKTYEAGNNDQRLELVNSVDNARFALDENEDFDSLLESDPERTAMDNRQNVESLEENAPPEWADQNQEEANTPAEKTRSAQETGQNDQEASRPINRDSMPVKAKNYLNTSERALVNKMRNLLSLPYNVGREMLQQVSEKISNEYLENGTISQQAIDEIFEDAYKQGIVVDEEYYNENRDIKDYIRSTKITLDEGYRSSIPDFELWRKANFGTVTLVNNGGASVDSVYQELQSMSPGHFPFDIINPADQLQKIVEVAKGIRKVEQSLADYYGNDPNFKRWAKNDFDAAVKEHVMQLAQVRQYANEKAAQKADRQVPTAETIEQVWKDLKDARRNLDRVRSKTLLTEVDEAVVFELLRGERMVDRLPSDLKNRGQIIQMYEAIRAYNELAKQTKAWKAQKNAELRELADEHLEDANDWKDKKSGLGYSLNTMERNVLDIASTKESAQAMLDTYFTPVHEAVAEATRFKNEYREKVRKMDLSRKIEKGNIVSEAHAVQLYGEAMDNIRMMEASKGRMETRDGHTLDEWREIVTKLWEENPNLNQKKVKDAVEEFKKIYDEFFQKMNQVRIAYGYEPINYRSGYFPHFQPGDSNNLLGRFGKIMGITTDVTALPTSINGLTHTFKPGITWFGNAQERLGWNTTYDAVEGFDKYIEGVADVIYMTESIQKLRALASQMRYRTTDDGIRKQVDEIRARDNLTEDEKTTLIEEINKHGKFKLSNFVNEIDEYTNLLANKKSIHDRLIEADAGRQIYNIAKALEGRVAANMVAINPASWLTNFSPIAQAWGEVDAKDLLTGMWNTLKAIKTGEHIIDQSTFLTNRQGSDVLVQSWEQTSNLPAWADKLNRVQGNWSKTLSSPMEWIDMFTAETVVRARMQQNQRAGLSEDLAIQEADSFAAGLMADRSKGALPTVFNRKNPVWKLLTQFQVEVNNTLGYVFKDLPRREREKGVKTLALALLKFLLGSWFYNQLYSALIGRRCVVDPIGILNETVGDFTGYEIPNVFEGDFDFKTTKKEGKDAFWDAFENIGGELPLVGSVFGGGRLPVGNAIPSVMDLSRGRTTVKKELLKPVTYLLPPFGGGQLKKLYEGIDATVRGGSYKKNSDGELELQYVVPNQTAFQAAMSAGRSVLFGKTTLPGARDWVDSGFKTMSAKKTAVYQALSDAGMDQQQAFEFINEISAIKGTDEEGETELKRKYLMDAEMDPQLKNVAYYGLLANEKERELLTKLGDMGADAGEAYSVLTQLKDAHSTDEETEGVIKRRILQNSGLTDDEKATIYYDLLNDKDGQAKLDVMLENGDSLVEVSKTMMAYQDAYAAKDRDGKFDAAINNGLSDESEMLLVHKLANGDGRDDDVERFAETGMGVRDFLRVYQVYGQINDSDKKPSEKAMELAKWMDDQGYTSKEQAAIKESFGFYSMVRADTDKYDELKASGLTSDKAYKLQDEIKALQPVAGKKEVSDRQKAAAIAASSLTDAEQEKAFGVYMKEETVKKFDAVKSYGVSVKTYSRFLEELEKADDGNGNYSQKEVNAALQALFGTSLAQSAYQQQAAALWQSMGKTWKKNPYSSTIGQAVIDALS